MHRLVIQQPPLPHEAERRKEDCDDADGDEGVGCAPAGPRESLELRVGRRTERRGIEVELLDHEAEGNDDNARSQARNVRSLAARSA